MAADGKIKIAIEVDGKQVGIASKELDRLENAGHKSGKGAKSAEQGLKGVGKEAGKASTGIKKIAKALGLVAIGTAAFRTLRASMDSAIARFDTLNNFPKVMQSLGVSAEESEKAIQKLSDGIEGLPTTLDDIASTAQRMYTSFNDMDKATDTAIALNNALLGSGASAEDAKRGAEQYMQALQRGKFEMEEWKTLQETMDVGLIKVAESFGFAGKTAKQDLYKALQDGTITMEEFNDKLIEVGTGTGIMAKLAKENSLGIATSLQNLRTAAAKGLADIIKSFDNLAKEVTGKDIAQNIDSLKVVINKSFKVIGNMIERTAPVVKGFTSALQAVFPVVKALSPALIGLASAYAMHAIIHKTTTKIQESERAMKIATAVKKLYTLAINQNARAQLAQTVATQASTIATKARSSALEAATAVELLFTKQITLAQFAMLAKAAAAKVLGAALKFLSGPVGWVTLAVGALVGAVVGIVKWFKRASEEGKKLTNETEKLGDSVENTNKEIDNNSKAYKENQKEIKSTAEANKNLIKRIDELARKENKSASETHLLKSYIDQLNQSVEGLNLTYDENADALSMSTEELQARVDLMREEESLIAAQERLLEIDKERNEVEMQLEEINALREEWNQKLEEGSIKSHEHKEAIKRLDEQEESLKQTLAGLSEQQALTEEQIKTSTENITEAVENGVVSQKLSYEDLTETQKQAVDDMKSKWEEYRDHTTNMFDTISVKSDLTVEEMTKNMEENQRIVGEWAENIAILTERGVDEGLLDILREAGPESAGHVKELVNASDEELQRLNEVFRQGGETATEALVKSLGIEDTGVMQAVGDLVTETEKSLKQQIESADFPKVGSAVAEGMAEGIKTGTGDTEKAAKEMAKATTKATESELGIQSPSKVFQTIGTNVTGGMTLGVSKGTSKVISAMNRLAKLSVYQFKNIKSDFKKIGRNAMSGLNDGLISGRSEVLATARGIANSVKRTMQDALKIQSPSKVMRDEVGKWIPEGIAEGIEDNVSSVYRALNDLSSGIMYVTPETALGTHRMAYSSAGNLGGGIGPTTTRGNQMLSTRRFNSLVNAIRDLASRPVSVQIDGREFAFATVDDMAEAIQFREKIRNSFKG